MKSKTEPTSARMKRLLEVPTAYIFNLYHMQGKDMTLGDFPSKMQVDKSDPHEIIPISFDLEEVPQEK